MRIPILDHGYITLVETWGGGLAKIPEAGIVEAARQSTQGGFRGWEHDARLLEYLHQNQHATPFEFAGMVIEVQAPIFVFREWHRHRTQSYNEMSARYAPLPDLNYWPTVNRCMMVNSDTTNKQAQSVTLKPLLNNHAEHWLADLNNLYHQMEAHYQLGLSIGIPKEIARCSMTVAHYSRMRAQATLRNWLAFLTLRMDPNAQWEIRQYAAAVGSLIADQFPQTWKLFRPE